MSSRPPSTRTKRLDRDNGSSDARGDSPRTKHDLKTDPYSVPASGVGRSRPGTDRSPNFRSDRGRGRDKRDDYAGRRSERGFGRGGRFDTRARHHSESSDDIKEDVRRQAGACL